MATSCAIFFIPGAYSTVVSFAYSSVVSCGSPGVYSTVVSATPGLLSFSELSFFELRFSAGPELLCSGRLEVRYTERFELPAWI